MDWGNYMDWVVLASVMVMLGTFIADLFRSNKDNKSFKGEHNRLSSEHDKLSKEHDNLHQHINESVSRENEILKADTSRIIAQNEAQTTMLTEIYSNSKKRDIQIENLTVSQRDAYQQMQKFNFLLSEVSRLQAENIELRKENIRLEKSNKLLNKQSDNKQCMNKNHQQKKL